MGVRENTLNEPFSSLNALMGLMQVLQVTLGDYIPRYHIFAQQEKEVDKLVQHWMQPTTLWDGNPVIGFMAVSYLDDLQTVGLKHFNPMWIFPATSVNQNWEPMTFGMAPWHIIASNALMGHFPYWKEVVCTKGNLREGCPWRRGLGSESGGWWGEWLSCGKWGK